MPSAGPGFEAFTVKFSGRVAQITTKVGVSLPFDPQSPPNPLPPRVERTALWDTGATHSVIGPDVAADLALKPVGSTKVSHASGTTISPTYLVNLYLPNRVGILGVVATELPENHIGPFRVIVGMDVIGLGDFALSNAGGKTTMSFRTPSCAAVDYVTEANRITFGGVSRNAPCPCDSGKKFKHCHGARPV